MTLESDVRFTPQDVLDVVREFDRIVLDPCTEPHNPVDADVFLCERGLDRSWRLLMHDSLPGIAFVNPPYSRGELLEWSQAAFTEWESSRVESILLVPADTSTRATQFLLRNANAVAFWKKRICFAGNAGAKFANAFFYFGERQGRFQRVFSPHAYVQVLR